MSGYSEYHPSISDPKAWVPYRYYPNLPAAAIFLAMFTVFTGWHALLLLRRRTWYYTPFVVGGIFEMIGYAGRIASTRDIWQLGPYIVQSIFLLVAPALFAASIYIMLGRIIRFTKGERYSLVPLRWLTKVFVVGDVMSFLLQMAGGGIQAGGTLSFLSVGEKIIIIGLFLQILFFGIFIAVATIFHRRYTVDSSTRSNVRREAMWKQHMWALYVGCGLIMIRSIFRVIEYLMGNNGYLLRNEYFLYIFDATLMFLVMGLFLWRHPSQLTMPGSTEEQEFSMEQTVVGKKHSSSTPSSQGGEIRSSLSEERFLGWR